MGSAYPDSTKRLSYLKNLEAFLNACMRVLRRTCDENGTFNLVRSRLSNARRPLTEGPLTFLPDSPPQGASTSQPPPITSTSIPPPQNSSAYSLYLTLDESDSEDEDPYWAPSNLRNSLDSDISVQPVPLLEAGSTNANQHHLPAVSHNPSPHYLADHTADTLDNTEGIMVMDASNPEITVILDDDDSVEFIGIAD